MIVKQQYQQYQSNNINSYKNEYKYMYIRTSLHTAWTLLLTECMTVQKHKQLSLILTLTKYINESLLTKKYVQCIKQSQVN
jgi:hypothetical protein